MNLEDLKSAISQHVQSLPKPAYYQPWHEDYEGDPSSDSVMDEKARVVQVGKEEFIALRGIYPPHGSFSYPVHRRCAERLSPWGGDTE